jgi:hypothetical protein
MDFIYSKGAANSLAAMIGGATAVDDPHLSISICHSQIISN